MMLNGIVETCIYATNLEETERFYRDILELKVVLREENRHVFFKCADSMLLLFNPEHTQNNQTFVNGNPIPLHGAIGPIHVAFSVESDQYRSIKRHLKDHEIPIESEVSWPNNSRSFYFRDPASNSLEIITGNMWK